jgi:hypothetical protein
MDAVSKGKGKKSDVTRIFWPSHCTEGDSGLLVGWNVHSFTASVATVATDIPLEMLHQALDIIGKSKRYSHLFFECGGAPGLLGEYRQNGSARQQVHAIRAIRQVANFWLTLDRHGNCPRLCDIHCCGFRYSVFSVTAQFVLYQQPNSSSYFSTVPFNPDPDRALQNFSQASDFEKALMQINESALVEQVLAEVVGFLYTGCTPAHLLWEADLWETSSAARQREVRWGAAGVGRRERATTMMRARSVSMLLQRRMSWGGGIYGGGRRFHGRASGLRQLWAKSKDTRAQG